MDHSKNLSDRLPDRGAQSQDQALLNAYEDQKARARSPNADIRIALAGASDTLPEILYFLAEDSVAEVRRCVALNENAPRQFRRWKFWQKINW